jgi:DNA adenine methylase
MGKMVNGLSKTSFKSPINWFGGKYYMASKINNIIPEHKLYVEVFGGAGHLLFKKEKSEIEVYNDIDSGLTSFFKVLRDKAKANELHRRLVLTLHSREEFLNCRDTWQDEVDEIERVRKWYVHLMQSFSGNCRSWSYSKTVSSRGMSQATSKYLSNIDDNLPLAVERFRTVQVENMDYKDLIKKYDTKDTLFYLDPPYIHNTRKMTFKYNYELTDNEHKELVGILLNIKGKAILSGYDNEIYNELIDNGWEKFNLGEFSERSTKTNMTKKQKRQEFLWVNFKF